MNGRFFLTKTMKTTIPVCFLTALLLLMATESAYAYLDPGSGSMLLQLLLGGAAGIAVILQLFWRRIASILRFKRTHSWNDGGPKS
jgi:hypothetical protein